MKVYAPNRDYTGVSASVVFCNGVGETNDFRLLEWFRSHGYAVEELEALPEPPVTEAELVQPDEKANGRKGKTEKAGE